MKKEGKKWAKGKYPSTSAGSMRRLLTTGVTVPFPVSNISNRNLRYHIVPPSVANAAPAWPLKCRG